MSSRNYSERKAKFDSSSSDEDEELDDRMSYHRPIFDVGTSHYEMRGHNGHERRMSLGNGNLGTVNLIICLHNTRYIIFISFGL